MLVRAVWVLVLLVTGLVVLSLGVGAAGLPLAEVWRTLWDSAETPARLIVWELRLPRALLGVLVGAALGASGATLQATLRNALAEPYLLGVSGGAAVGAVMAAGLGFAGLGTLATWAFAGALVAVGVVLMLGRDRQGARPPASLLMAGVVTGAFANAVIMVVLAQSTPTAQRNALWWMMGSLSAARWSDVAGLALAVAVLGAGLLHMARSLDVIALGGDTAASLGEASERVAMRLFVLASLLAAATVATAGLVGFVGLMVPHLARAVVRDGNSRRTLVVAALGGSALVLLADLAARTLRAPAELPLGAVTALLGVPFFLWQLRRNR